MSQSSFLEVERAFNLPPTTLEAAFDYNGVYARYYNYSDDDDESVESIGEPGPLLIIQCACITHPKSLQASYSNFPSHSTQASTWSPSPTRLQPRPPTPSSSAPCPFKNDGSSTTSSTVSTYGNTPSFSPVSSSTITSKTPNNTAKCSMEKSSKLKATLVLSKRGASRGRIRQQSQSGRNLTWRA